MKLLKLLLLILSFSVLLLAQNPIEDNNTENNTTIYVPATYADLNGVCYKFDKEEFNESLKIPEDIIVSHVINEIDPEPISIFLNFQFAKSDQIPSADLQCLIPDYDVGPDHSNKCTGFNNEKIQFYIKDNVMYLHIDHMQMSLADQSILYRVASKKQTFSKGVKIPCEPRKAQIRVLNVKEGSKKQKLLKSIDIGNVIIYDLDYHKNIVIAVGEDNSVEMREYRCQNGDHLRNPVVLKSEDGGKSWNKIEKEYWGVDYFTMATITNEKNIIISDTYDETTRTTLTSFNNGKSWEETGNIRTSKDGGKNWQESLPIQKNEPTTTSHSIQRSKPKHKSDTLSVLSIPNYRVNYETNTLIVQHRKKTCNCDQFTLPLTYNQSNTRKGILGSYWSLGIENHITIQNKDELLFFDAYKGKEQLYVKDVYNKNIFRYGGETIQKTKDGYTRTCDPSKQYFDLNGYLIKVEYPEKSYVIQYQNKKISKVKELIKGKESPYLSFDYQYESVVITFHHATNVKNITFLKNSEGLLSSILDGNKHIFHYTYQDYRLLRIQNFQKKDPYQTLLQFSYYPYKNKALTVHDSKEEENGIIKEVNHLHYDKDKEHICLVNTLTKNLQKGILQDVRSDIKMYRFNYYDTNHTKLLSTQHGSQTYGFDRQGRINFYDNDEGNISITYNQFYRMKDSIIYKEEKAFKYTYTYSDDKHNLKTITSPQGTVELSHNEQNQIIEMMIDKHHLKFEYSKDSQPTKIIVVGKGEIITTYSDKGEIKNVKNVLYGKTFNANDMALDVTQAMSQLTQMTSEGSIRSYPRWI